MYEIKDDLDEVVISKNNKNNLDTISILMDDLNTPGLITELNKIVKEYNSLEVDRENIKTRLSLISKVLGILQDETFNNISEEFKSKIDDLVAKRSNAKKNKNFELADAIREELLELGIEIKDSSDGTKWTLKS